AGSGSEVSEALVLHDPDFAGHVVIRGRGYGPRVALLDGELLATLPRRPMILAALDALRHRYEAPWARGPARLTHARALAAAGAATEMAHLPRLYEEIGFVPRFAAEELSGGDVELMVRVAMENPFRDNNRRPLGEADVRGLLDRALP